VFVAEGVVPGVQIEPVGVVVGEIASAGMVVVPFGHAVNREGVAAFEVSSVAAKVLSQLAG
jgi:hypothetical protein